MNMQNGQEVLEMTGDEARRALPRIVIVGGAGLGVGASLSLMRAIRESDLAGPVIVLDHNLYGALPESRALSQPDPGAALAKALDVLLADAAHVGLVRPPHVGLVRPHPAPLKLAAPRELTQADTAKLEAARLKRERKAARLRAVSALS